MCGIFAAIGRCSSRMASDIIRANVRRGRDGYGTFTLDLASVRTIYKTPGVVAVVTPDDPFATGIVDGVALGNCRAEPTTELVNSPTFNDQQPYEHGKWAIVHNGTIANDKELDMRFELDPPTRIDSWVIVGILDKLERDNEHASPAEVFKMMLGQIDGAFAIIAVHADHPGAVMYATNYRPLYAHTTTEGVCVLSSVRIAACDMLVAPYSFGMATMYGTSTLGDLRPYPRMQKRTLVVLSGGLDSTAVAAICKNRYHDYIELLHFDYGCRATTQERAAVEAIAHALEAKLHVVNMRDIFAQIGGSRLTGTHEQISNGEAGAERAIEWVPARNTILASVAMGIAEARNFDCIALGINLEESGGGYTDNVLDLYEGFNSLMQWIIGEGKRLEFISPVGHLMKHEIVAEGIQYGAPFELSWSCYNNGLTHCGNCGPCIMRKRAFERGGHVDPVFKCD